LPSDARGLFSVPAPPFHHAWTAGFFFGAKVSRGVVRPAGQSYTWCTEASARDVRFTLARSVQVLAGGYRGGDNPTMQPYWMLTISDATEPGAARQSIAQLRHPGIQATCHVDRPSLGIRYEGMAAGAPGLLRVERATDAASAAACWQTEDCYVRGRDLIATYAPAADWPFRCQVYWRVVPAAAPVAAALDLVVSVQTELLDTHPQVHVRSWFPAGSEVLQVVPSAPDERTMRLSPDTSVTAAEGRAGCFLFRAPGRDRSYVQMVHPADFVEFRLVRDADAGSAAGITATHVLFRRPLEKGVILRSRIRSAWLPGAADAAEAAESYRRFIAEAPPLTV
jgi:hypothetical protein